MKHLLAILFLLFCTATLSAQDTSGVVPRVTVTAPTTNGCPSACNPAETATFTGIILYDVHHQGGAWSISPCGSISSFGVANFAGGTACRAGQTVTVKECSKSNSASCGSASVTMAAASTVATPTFSPASPYTGPTTKVRISDATRDAAIVYCQDSTNTCTPTKNYLFPVSFTDTGYIRAQAKHTGWSNSAIASWQGTLKRQ